MDTCFECMQFNMCYLRRAFSEVLVRGEAEGELITIRTDYNRMYGDGITTWLDLMAQLAKCCVRGRPHEKDVKVVQFRSSDQPDSPLLVKHVDEPLKVVHDMY